MVGECGRFAIYWVPEPGSQLARFARTWFAAPNPQAGGERPDESVFGLDPGFVARVTQTPRRYTLHGTLKAPFFARPGVRVAEVIAALEAFCARRCRVRAGPLHLTRMGSYLVLMPAPPLAELDWLAASCVTAFDRFRAPLTEEERARRAAQDLTPRQACLLEEFGYPYVLSEFHFHITLAGPLEEADFQRLEQVLRPALAPLGEEPFVMGALALFGDPGEGRQFVHIASAPFCG